jgi:hypothetical protein
MLIAFTACNQANATQRKLGLQADNFEVYRKVTMINLRSDKIILEVEGYISIKDSSNDELAIIICTAPNTYKMHYIYTGSETMYMVQQVDDIHTDPYHFEIHIYTPTLEIEVNK